MSADNNPFGNPKRNAQPAPKPRGRPRKGIAVDADFIAMAANGTDPKAAAEMVQRQAAHLFDAERGAELETLNHSVKQDELRLAEIDDERGRVSKERQSTPEWQRAARKSGTREVDDSAEVHFKEWALLDQITVGGCGILCLVMLGAGAANIQGNLVASGLPLFTLNPVFAWLFAMLAPAAALAIHSFGHVFRSWAARNAYRLVIYALTGICVIAWSWLFADLFHGTGGALDLSFEEDRLADTLFVWLQVATEILVGSALFLIIEHISAKYSPNFWLRNPEYVELKVKEEALDASRAEVVARVREIKGEHARLVAQRDTAITAAHAELLQFNRRYGQS